MLRRNWFRHTLNTLTGINLFGLIVGVLSRGKPEWDAERGLLVFMSCQIRWPRAAAMTFGDIVVVRAGQWQRLADVPAPLMQHEAEHARQYLFTLGLPYFPLYWIACAYSYVRTGNYWSRNAFEVKAGLQNGGYR
jgi:hypothetical protein